MKKILITGFSGFVAFHFVKFLYQENLCHEILGIDLKYPDYDYQMLKDRLPVRFQAADMVQAGKVRQMISEFMPDYILHLAAFSSVAYSWKHPAESFMNNSNIFLNLISAVRDLCPGCRILSVGSSEEYGNALQEEIPLKESQRVHPASPYAVARAAQEMLSKVFVDAYGMEIIMTRSFNHAGPGQNEKFVVPGFIKQILEIKKRGLAEGKIETGNLSIVRDFVDVRDVARAYYLLMTKGKSGEIYNVCSGKGTALSEVVHIIEKETGISVSAVLNPELVRPSDNMEIVGSSYKIESELGWKRKYGFQETVRDMIKQMSGETGNTLCKADYEG